MLSVNIYTVFIRMDVAATINFKSREARRLFEGGVYYVYTGKLPE